jgi:hypothetical protein
MDAALTLRLGGGLRRKLRSRAASLGVSEAELVRQALDREVRSEPLRERARKLRGIVTLPHARGDAFRDRLRSRNWRA